jgi:hypothetical protein
VRGEGEKEKGRIFCLGEGKRRKRVERGDLGDTISVCVIVCSMDLIN